MLAWPLSLLLAAPPGDSFETDIAAAVRDVEHVYPVPTALVMAVIQQESGYNPKAISRAGAIDLMQVMPFTAPRVGLTPPSLGDPAKNILAGTRLLAVLLRYYHGDLISTLVAYNTRPRKLFAPIPHNGETARYVTAVLLYFAKYSSQSSSKDLARETARSGHRAASRASAHSRQVGL